MCFIYSVTLNDGSESHLSRPFTLKVECDCVLSRLSGHSKWTFGHHVCSTSNSKRRACVYCDLFRLSWHETSKCEPQCVITLTAVLHALITYMTVNKRRKKPQDTSLNINITVRAVMNSCSLGGGLSII
jgi:hypothetical protein